MQLVWMFLCTIASKVLNKNKHESFKRKKNLNYRPLLVKQLYFLSGNYSGTTSTILTVIISSYDNCLYKIQTRCIITPSTGQHSEMTQVYVSMYEVQKTAHCEIHLHKEKSQGEPYSRKYTESAFGENVGARL